MYFLVENRFLIYYDKEYWERVLPGREPQNYLNSDLYSLNKRGSNYLHNSKGPAVIDLKTNQELFFIEGQQVDSQTLHNMRFKGKFEELINDSQLDDISIAVATFESYNVKGNYELIVRKRV